MAMEFLVNIPGPDAVSGRGGHRSASLVVDEIHRTIRPPFDFDRSAVVDHFRGSIGSAAPTGHPGHSDMTSFATSDMHSWHGSDAGMAAGVGASYYIEGVGGTLSDDAGAGIDTVRTGIDFTLPANVENALIEGSAGRTLYGNDLDNGLFGNRGDDTIFGGDGNDLIKGGDGNDYLGGEAGNDMVVGGDGNDYLFGDEGNDNLSGGDGADYLQGYTGSDQLDGGSGDDFLAGGPGADTLTGGAGRDTFYFYDFTESTAAAPDRITDFTTAGHGGDCDQLDLSGIDANLTAAGDQAFAGLASGPAAHGLWMSAVSTNADGSVDFTLYGDVNGDHTADFALVLHSTAGFSAADILF